jgi:phage terminase Nu1 subunit (DNA packaging protein)
MEIGTAAAATVLGVTTRRVSQLAQAGILVGRKVGRTWLLHRPSVLDHRDAKGHVA